MTTTEMDSNMGRLLSSSAEGAALCEMYRQAYEIVRLAPDTLTDEFQLAAAIVKVFDDWAESRGEEESGDGIHL